MKRKLDAQQITRKLKLHVICASIVIRKFLRLFLKKTTCKLRLLARSSAGGCLTGSRGDRIFLA